MPNLEAVEPKNFTESASVRNTGNRRRSRPLPLVHNSEKLHGSISNNQQNSNTLPAAIALSKETAFGYKHDRQNSVPYDYQHHTTGHIFQSSENRTYFRSPSVP